MELEIMSFQATAIDPGLYIQRRKDINVHPGLRRRQSYRCKGPRARERHQIDTRDNLRCTRSGKGLLPLGLKDQTRPSKEDH
jgi:hypothetical protein